MSYQLRQARSAATVSHMLETVSTLSVVAQEFAEKGDPACLLLNALLYDLDDPSETYRAALVAATVTADSDDPLCVDRVCAGLVSVAKDKNDPLLLSLARELGAAARLGRNEQQGFTSELGDIDTVPEDWT